MLLASVIKVKVINIEYIKRLYNYNINKAIKIRPIMIDRLCRTGTKGKPFPFCHVGMDTRTKLATSVPIYSGNHFKPPISGA